MHAECLRCTGCANLQDAIGSLPCPLHAGATQTAHARGIVLEGAARQVAPRDFQDFDLILAMDSSNLHDLQEMAEGERKRTKVRLLREFDPASAGVEDLDVPDPYYGGSGGFEEVLDLVQAACAGLLRQIRSGQLT